MRQALSLAQEQKWLRQTQANARTVAPGPLPLAVRLRNEIAEHLATVFLRGVLKFRAYHRVSLAPSLDLQRAPVRPQLLEDLCRRNPDHRRFLTSIANSACLAMPPMPPSLVLVNLSLRCGVVPVQLNTASLDMKSRCQVQLYILIGCEHVPAPPTHHKFLPKVRHQCVCFSRNINQVTPITLFLLP